MPPFGLEDLYDKDYPMKYKVREIQVGVGNVAVGVILQDHISHDIKEPGAAPHDTCAFLPIG